MIADIAHELRTPLTIMLGRLEALDDGLATFDAAEAHILHQQTLLLSRLVEDPRVIIPGRLRPTIPAKTPARTGTAGSSRASEFRGASSCAGHRFHLNAHGPIEVHADPERISQVPMNLLDNAIRFIPRDGRLKLEIIADKKATQVILTDSGPGIPNEELSQVFDRFFRIEASRDRAGGGSGLGLAIMKTIVELHGGQVGVRNTGTGAQFTLTLPLTQPSPSSIISQELIQRLFRGTKAVLRKMSQRRLGQIARFS